MSAMANSTLVITTVRNTDRKEGKNTRETPLLRPRSISKSFCEKHNRTFARSPKEMHPSTKENLQSSLILETPKKGLERMDVVHNDDELRLNLDLVEERRERAAIREAQVKLKMKRYYDARVKNVALRPGDFVYRSNDASHAVEGGKLGPKWEVPYEVLDALGDGTYKLRSSDGAVLPRT
ncbi:hypothetical protein Tco_0749779 [Tanacetum coccineum]|uniref:Reverse transcriptase domain-containing protein n=1 Tax=Tanacetum coccineum TaxID=301880 RepID=A0ABQ4Z2G1_9ASTR